MSEHGFLNLVSPSSSPSPLHSTLLSLPLISSSSCHLLNVYFLPWNIVGTLQMVTVNFNCIVTIDIIMHALLIRELSLIKGEPMFYSSMDNLDCRKDEQVGPRSN